MPSGPRAALIAVVLSLLLAGLGHVYLGRFGRALIWFAGILIVAVILRQEDIGAWLSAGMVVAVSVCAALDSWILIRLR